MKRFLASERSRAGLLIVAAALIGGTGCVTAMVVGSASSAAQMAQAKLQRQQREEKLQRENADIRNAAEHGDVAAMTRLGWYEVSGDRFGLPADPRGMTLLEQAAARQYVPAQYMLGLVLLGGTPGVTPDPARGLALLRLAATRTCRVDVGRDATVYDFPARTLANLYHNGSAANSVDLSEAELWLARNAVYCRNFSYNAVEYPSTLSATLRRARQEAWAQLAGESPQTNAPPEQMQETARELQRLRQLVRDSESRYPAPPQPAS